MLIVLLEERLKNKKLNESNIYLSDLYNFFFNLSLKIIKLKSNDKINKIIVDFSNDNNNNKLRIISNIIPYYKDILQLNPKVKEYLIPVRKEDNKNTNFNLPILALGGVSLAIALISLKI